MSPENPRFRARVARAAATPIPPEAHIVNGRDYAKSRERRRQWAIAYLEGARVPALAASLGKHADHVREELRRFIDMAERYQDQDDSEPAR